MAAWALVPTQSAEIIKKVSLQSEAMFSQKLFLIYLKKNIHKKYLSLNKISNR